LAKWIRHHRLVTALACAIALALAVAATYAFAGGLDDTTTVTVSGTGPQVVRVALVERAVGFDVTPDVLEVEAGTHVILDVVNEGSGDHDLAFDERRRTDVLGPGETQRLDLGRITDDPTGRCTIGDHDIAGMDIDVRLT
jgi:nitrite reductase (NO-forming)